MECLAYQAQICHNASLVINQTATWGQCTVNGSMGGVNVFCLWWLGSARPVPGLVGESDDMCLPGWAFWCVPVLAAGVAARAEAAGCVLREQIPRGGMDMQLQVDAHHKPGSSLLLARVWRCLVLQRRL